MKLNIEQFITSYFRYWDIKQFENRWSEEDEWAIDLLDYNLVRNSPEEAWPLILELVKAAQHKRHLSIIAAGSLEELINNHGASVIERIETEVRRNPRFAWTMLCVWPGKKDKGVYTRVKIIQEKYKKHDIELDA